MHPAITGSFIAVLRKEHNLTQKQLAEKLNVSDKAISRWETGKGYPDIESLMALSQTFSVSINELLSGKRIDNPAMAQAAEKHIADAYIHTRHKKRIASVTAVVLAIVLSVVTAFSSVGFVYFSVNFYDEIMGSPSCVIAQDYSSITLFNQRYVPLVLEDIECSPSQCLIEEAQVEGAAFIDKLLFSEKIYSVKQCPNNEIIYLQTEDDSLSTPYYCLEGKQDTYIALSQQDTYNILTAQITTKDWLTCELTLEKDLTEMLINQNYTISPVNCDWSRGDGDESIVIHASQQNSPLIRIEGELLRKQEQYYWFDYDDIPDKQHNADYSAIMAYKIDDSYDAALDILFSYMFQ